MLEQIARFQNYCGLEQHLEPPEVVCEALTAATGFQTYVAEMAVLEYVVVSRGDVVEAHAGPSELCLSLQNKLASCIYIYIPLKLRASVYIYLSNSVLKTAIIALFVTPL